MLRASSARRDAPLWGGQGGSLAQKAGSERLDGALREGEALRVELNALRQNLEKAEGDKTRVRSPAASEWEAMSAAVPRRAAMRAWRMRQVCGFQAPLSAKGLLRLINLRGAFI